MRRSGTLGSLLCGVLLIAPTAPAARADEHVQTLVQRLGDAPLDAEARLELADALIDAGDTRRGRRHLRAFLRLHLEHPQRIDVARRVASLLGDHIWDLHDWDEEIDKPPVYRNVVDGALAVRVDGGWYQRILHPTHPVAGEEVEVRFTVDLPHAYLADLHETRDEAWQWFVRES